ncbi:MAG: glycosyltransferase family 1 protein, partial [Nitrospirota bacterium]
GFIVGAQSAERLEEKILCLYESPELMHEMGKNALETAREEYSWDAYGMRLHDVLSDAYL